MKFIQAVKFWFLFHFTFIHVVNDTNLPKIPVKDTVLKWTKHSDRCNVDLSFEQRKLATGLFKQQAASRPIDS